MHKPLTMTRGFTLIELMITLAILAILVTVAYPSYTSQVTKSRRADGKAALMDAAARQERFYTENNTYTATMTDLGYAADPAISPDGHYAVAAAAGTTADIATSYALTATPQGVQASDALCANLTINNVGTKGISGTSTVALCW